MHCDSCKKNKTYWILMPIQKMIFLAKIGSSIELQKKKKTAALWSMIYLRVHMVDCPSIAPVLVE